MVWSPGAHQNTHQHFFQTISNAMAASLAKAFGKGKGKGDGGKSATGGGGNSTRKGMGKGGEKGGNIQGKGKGKATTWSPETDYLNPNTPKSNAKKEIDASMLVAPWVCLRCATEHDNANLLKCRSRSCRAPRFPETPTPMVPAVPQLKPAQTALLNRYAPGVPQEEGAFNIGEDEDDHDRYQGDLNYLQEMLTDRSES